VLAVHLVKQQGIDVIGLHLPSFFSSVDPVADDSPVNVTARQVGIPVLLRKKGPEFLDIIRNPKHGHGKNLNPCIDCRIQSLITAKQVMEEVGASFIVTGEVVGQRPMSQMRNTLRMIEKEAACTDIVLRPLSAKILPETLPEKLGLVDRNQLLAVAGRGRKVQIKLAEEIGLTGYSAPAGGCLLTDKQFSRRLKDVLDDRDKVSQDELTLLTVGRHLRIRPGLKVIVGRNKADNEELELRAALGTLFSPIGFPGPVVLAIGEPTAEEEKLVGAVIRRYSKERSRGESIGITRLNEPARTISVTDTADQERIAELMI
jgi:hypothetical protein